MSFRSVSMLWLLVLVPFAITYFLAAERTRARIARRFASERLRGISTPPRAARPYLLGIALLGALAALAGPYAGYTTIPVMARESNRVLVIDVSNSMAAEDVGTSRLAAAKALAKRLIETQPGRVGLVVFEGSPSIVAPMTSDTDAVLALLDTLQPGEIGQPGSDIGNAVLAALALVQADPAQKADIVVISDGEDQGTRIPDAIQRSKAHGVEVVTILLGTRAGSTIPGGDGPLRDESGQAITTYARPEAMQALSGGTGGKMYENPFAENALDPLLAHTVAGRARETQVRVPVDRYQWPLALAFFALIGASVLNRGAE